MLRYVFPGVIGLVLGLLLGGVIAYEWVNNDVERTEVPGGYVYAFENGMTMKIDRKEDGEFILTKPLTITKVVHNDRVEVQFEPQAERTGGPSEPATDVVVAVAEDDSDQKVMDKLNVIGTNIDALATSIGKLPTSVSSPELKTVVQRTEEMQETLTAIKTTVGELPGNASPDVREVPVAVPSPELQAVAKRTEEMQQILVGINTAVEKLTTAVNDLPDSASSTKLKTVVDQTASLVRSIGDINKDVDTLLEQGKDDASASGIQTVLTRLNEVRQEIGADIDVLITSVERDIPEVTIHVPEVRPEPIRPAPPVPDVHIHTPSTMSLIGAEGYGLTVPDLERIHSR